MLRYNIYETPSYYLNYLNSINWSYLPLNGNEPFLGSQIDFTSDGPHRNHAPFKFIFSQWVTAQP